MDRQNCPCCGHPIRVCPACGTVIDAAPRRGRPRRFCSDRCRSRAAHAAARARPLPAATPEEIAAVLASQTWAG